MLEMVIKKPVSPEDRQFLKRSQCGFFNGLPYVCCTNDSSSRPSKMPLTTEAPKKNIEGPSAEALKKLKKMLPQPPFCGSDSQDRIFGGIGISVEP